MSQQKTIANPPIVRSPMRERPLFVVIAGAEFGRMLVVGAGVELLIGREEDADLRIEDASISRRHALVCEDHGEVTLCDLGSRNGTYVNGERLTGERCLDDGDQIQLGGICTLKFTLVDELDLEYQRRMHEAALYDPLTGVYNRRCLDERLRAESAAVQRHGGALSLLLLDIDHFKRVNDEHGHLAGDAVLKAIAGGLQAQLRREDLIARYGGEEFAVIARGTSLDGAELFAERLRQWVESAVCLHDGAELRVTTSIGVAQSEPGTTPQQLVEAADAGLYRAKHRGRNQVVATLY
jgi:diguanylate cyclase (GGDEF)-like protein